MSAKRAVDTDVRELLHARRQEPKLARMRRSSFEQVWISKTVLLETYWVSTSSYGFPDEAIATVMLRAAALPNVHLEDQDAVLQALEWYQLGIEFADALHLASRGHSEFFVTFDQRLAKRSQRLSAPVQAL